MVTLKENSKKLIDGLEKIYIESIAQDIEENGIEKIIERELNNHECGYTGEIDIVVSILADYKISEEQIITVFRKMDFSDY